MSTATKTPAAAAQAKAAGRVAATFYDKTPAPRQSAYLQPAPTATKPPQVKP